MNGPRKRRLVLSIYPNTRGFAFVLFEGPLAPVDWGIMEARGKSKNRQCLRRIASLLGRYQPEIVVLQNTSDTGTYRHHRIHKLNDAIEVLAETQGILACMYSRTQIRECFAHLGTPTKHNIALAIAKHIPAFERLLPRIRKPWMSEDARMGLFDAAALAIRYFQGYAQSAASSNAA